MPTDVTLRPAEPADREYVETRLTECGLPVNDLSTALEHLSVCETGDERIGVGGLEMYGTTALLRSVAVDEAVRGVGHGTAMCTALLDRARDAGVEEVYLLTTTADEFFARIGFERAERETAPEAIQETAQFRDVCPQSAVCMRRQFDAQGTGQLAAEDSR